MKKFLTLSFALLLCVATLLTLASCGKYPNKPEDLEAQLKDEGFEVNYVYKPVEIEEAMRTLGLEDMDIVGIVTASKGDSFAEMRFVLALYFEEKEELLENKDLIERVMKEEYAAFEGLEFEVEGKVFVMTYNY